jgi:predicted DNA-binding transcriptional regulator YafY
MRRADRLFRIIEHLRGGRLVTARDLAGRLEVSERTVYRDMRDLMASGVPIDGEAGVGYVLRPGHDLPPVMFERDELEALAVGARLLRAWAGSELADAAERAVAKIEAVLPDDGRRKALTGSRLFAPAFHTQPEVTRRIDLLRQAINDRRTIAFSYVRADQSASSRQIRPLGLFFWGKVWTLAGWCELRDDFRNFRVDRIAALEIRSTTWREEPGKSLADFLRRCETEDFSSR